VEAVLHMRPVGAASPDARALADVEVRAGACEHRDGLALKGRGTSMTWLPAFPWWAYVLVGIGVAVAVVATVWVRKGGFEGFVHDLAEHARDSQVGM
jgi:uncharacterized membrane protein